MFCLLRASNWKLETDPPRHTSSHAGEAFFSRGTVTCLAVVQRWSCTRYLRFTYEGRESAGLGNRELSGDTSGVQAFLGFCGLEMLNPW